MIINPSSHKQFEIWELRQPLGTKYPVEYVLVISNTRGLKFSQEPQVNVLPIYYSKLTPPVMSNRHIDYPYIQGGADTYHQLRYSAFIGTMGVVTMDKFNLSRKVSNLQGNLRAQVISHIQERFSF